MVHPPNYSANAVAEVGSHGRGRHAKEKRKKDKTRTLRLLVKTCKKHRSGFLFVRYVTKVFKFMACFLNSSGIQRLSTTNM